MLTTVSFRPMAFRFLLGLPVAAALSGIASAHEAWLLSPAETQALSQVPAPHLFTSGASLALASVVWAAVIGAALWAERRFAPVESALAAPLAKAAPVFGPLAVRLGLAAMLVLSAAGGSPRHGTAPWSEPTLFVPDMQLLLAPGWDWLVAAQIVLAAAIAAGFLTRFAALGLIALSVLGLVVFGSPFLAYAPHFIAPALMLVVCGAGALSVDRVLDVDDWLRPSAAASRVGWAAALALLGAGFVFLAVSCKLFHPMLLMEILGHGHVPLLGLPLPVAVLVMAGVELGAGILLAFGRLVRPIALFLIGSFTFLAITLGESPLLHANLYAAMVMLAMAGREVPHPVFERRMDRAVLT